MSLFSCKVELKFRQTKFYLHTVMMIIVDDNCNNIIFTIKGTKLFVPVDKSSTKGNQKLSKFLSKGFE